MRWEHHSEDFLSTSSTFLIILNEFSAYFKHNSAESTIGIFVNLLMEPCREVVPSPSPQHPHTMPMRTSVTHVGAPECVQTFFANPLKTGSSSCQASASAVSLAFEVRRDCSDASLWVRVYRRLSGVSRERLLAGGF